MPKKEELRQELYALTEPEYQKFSASLLPGTDNILGVRLPALRKLAGKLAREDWLDWLEELESSEDAFFEETMLAGMVIGEAKIPLEERFRWIRRFVPRIDNWSVCDSFCAGLREAQRRPRDYWAFLEEFFASGEEFSLRFALVMATDHFVTPEWLPRVLDRLDAFSHPGYYAKMAAAWALSICFVKFPSETLPRLQASPLDDFTYNKALQKICDSHRIDPQTRTAIRAMKRKTT